MSSPAGKCPTSSTKKSSAFDILDEDDDEATITRLNSSVLCGMNLGNRGSKSSSADMFDDSVDEQLLGNVAEAAEQESEVFAEGVKAATSSPVKRRSSRSSRASQDINYNEDCQEFSSSKHPHKKGTQRKPSSPTTKENASPSEPSSSHSSKKRRVISWSDSSADESRSPKRSERTSKDSSPDPPSSKKLNRSKKKRRGPPSESSPNKESRDEPEKKDTRDSNLQSKSDTKKTSKGIKKLSKDESLLKEKDASRKKSNSSDKHQHPSKKNSAKVRLKTKNIPEGDPRQKKTPQKTISSRASKTKTTPKPKVQKNFVLGDLDDSDSFDDEPVHKTPVKGKKSPGSGRRRRLDPDELARISPQRSEAEILEEKKLNELAAELLRRRDEARQNDKDYEKARAKEERAKRKEDKKLQKLMEANLARQNKLETDLDQGKFRSKIRSLFPFLQEIWDGKSHTYRSRMWKKGGAERSGLKYDMLIHSYGKNYIKWAFEELKEQYMPTGHLYSKHQEFVTKVLLSDLLIKIYADHFKMEFEEAEKHIQDTPNAPEI